MASSKVIVEEPLYEEFCGKFAAKAATLKVGDPHSTETFIGPLIRQSQCEFITAQLDEATQRGASVLTGGSYSERFFQPTVLRDVDRNMRIYHEESFGPVVSVIKVKDSEEALKVANDTKYGPSAAVLTNDMQKAIDLSLRLESGMVHVNDTTISDEPHVPFGGVKESGFGSRGRQALLAGTHRDQVDHHTTRRTRLRRPARVLRGAGPERRPAAAPPPARRR